MQEHGYTPSNLRAVLNQHGITQQALANILGVNLKTAQRWCKPLENSDHHPMPHRQWVALLKKLEKNN